MWVNVISTRSDDNKYRLNLGVALGIREYDDRFEVYYAGDNDPYKVKKTPEMVEAYNSLVPAKSQPVVSAEPDQYEWVTQDIEPVRPGVDQYRYLRADGCERSMWGLASSHDRRWDDRCVHGWVDPDGDTLELRCRRFQLPEVLKPEEPFRITGLGLYRSEDGDAVKIDHRDSSDTEVPWRSDKGSWYMNDGCRYFGAEPRFNIVKLIKLDEVQP